MLGSATVRYMVVDRTVERRNGVLVWGQAACRNEQVFGVCVHLFSSSLRLLARDAVESLPLIHNLESHSKGSDNYV